MQRLVSRDLSAALHSEAMLLADGDVAIDAGVGRADGRTRDQFIRRSRIHWIDGATVAQRRFLRLAESLRQALNSRLFLGLFEFEAQLALYQPQGFYARHLDSFQGARNRVVSLVTYFNEEWADGDGGELLIWSRAPDGGGPDGGGIGPPDVIVRPEAGTLVLMLSEEIPHEVAPSRRSRASIAGWWRVNTPSGASSGASSRALIDPAT